MTMVRRGSREPHQVERCFRGKIERTDQLISWGEGRRGVDDDSSFQLR